MKFIVDLELETYKQIVQLVKAGKYSSVHEFFEISVQNQLSIESRPVEVNDSEKKPAWTSYLTIPPSNTNIFPIPDRNRLDQFPLWGQYYRFLPLKIVLRVLSNLCQAEPCDLTKASKTCVEVACDLGEQLRKNDIKMQKTRSNKLSTAFPSRTDKSMDRFSRQFVGYVRASDGILVGMGEELLLINIIEDKIAPTRYGFEFACLKNPVIDDKTFSKTLSEQETNFIFAHIIKRVGTEAEHIRHLLKGLKEGPKTRSQLVSHMRTFYKKFEGKQPWSSQMVEMMSAGLVSRVHELGLLDIDYQKANALYFLTKEGERVINELFTFSSEPEQ